ncbi:MAG TPA: YCF48-related protein [Pyrinomonadaceae bacterium]|nr:YCF48-related protein [Pyrinomonadaceae bacterium]
MFRNPFLRALILVLLIGTMAHAEWVTQQSGTTVRLRGVSTVSQRVAWASGDKGTFARTVDGGRNWTSGTVPGAEELDFRDVDAFDAETAYLLSIGEGEKSRIYKTTDGGRHWELQFKSERAAAFFDSMAFWDRERGIAVSDPVDGRFIVIQTADGGKTWKETPADGMPPALEGEGAFAASGTCIAVEGRTNAWFATGGPRGARVFRSLDGGRTWAAAVTPIVSGKSAGVFSITFWDARRGVVVGGDYTQEGEAVDNVAVTTDGGRTWALIKGAGPGGYRSCVVFVPGTGSRSRAPTLFAVGPTGSEYSTDGGNSWQSFGTGGYHSADFAGPKNAGWAVGERGVIGKYEGARPK